MADTEMKATTTTAAAIAPSAAGPAVGATASKKKYKNKKKMEKTKQQQQQLQQNHKVEVNGHREMDKTEEEAEADGSIDGKKCVKDLSEINGLISELHICNGHKAKCPNQLEEAAAAVAVATPMPLPLNGHSNNNHIYSNNNNNSINNNKHKNQCLVDKSNNNSNSSTIKLKSSEKLARNGGTNQTTILATSTLTANTQTTTATTTKTTPLETGKDAIQASTSAEAASETPTTAATTNPASTLTSTTNDSTQLIVVESPPAISADEIIYKEYEAEFQMHDIMRLIQAELSEPYSIYTYRYFIYNWPKLCFLASHENQYVGAIVCKLDMHMNCRRGYIAMLAVRKEYRKLKIGTTLVTKAIEAMLADNADEVVLETEMRNEPALRLYENLGFVRDKRLFRYYLNGVDALRLKLWFR
ncbi:N-alpha-acetyltransferase 30A [Drosophila tropicalis]|uniref:N-alpha-acetyltransferase 30A n=1 Tax=Drosophila tropicalis TaxID=46794 RepID=UPI0035AC1A12